jgi:ribulose-5-phosphate 4-epimerase/fuculose-1-phosphate aldolase
MDLSCNLVGLVRHIVVLAFSLEVLCELQLHARTLTPRMPPRGLCQTTRAGQHNPLAETKSQHTTIREGDDTRRVAARSPLRH